MRNQDGTEVPVFEPTGTEDDLAYLLGDAYICTRVWEAWEIGTMTEEDFTPADTPDVRASLIAWRDAAVTAALLSSGRGAEMAHEFNVLTGRFTKRREPEDFEESSCDAPGYFDPLHREEVSVRCALLQGHQGKHRGYIPAEWRDDGRQVHSAGEALSEGEIRDLRERYPADDDTAASLPKRKDEA